MASVTLVRSVVVPPPPPPPPEVIEVVLLMTLEEAIVLRDCLLDEKWPEPQADRVVLDSLWNVLSNELKNA